MNDIWQQTLNSGYAALINGNYDEGRVFFEAALEQAKPWHDDDLDSRSLLGLALAYFHEDPDSAAAHPTLLRALAAGEKAYECGHPGLARLHGALAWYYGDTKDLESAAKHAQEAVKQMQSSSNRAKLTYLAEYLNIRLAQKELSDAEAIWKQLHEIRIREFGEHSIEIALSLGEYQQLLIDMERHEEANQAFSEIMAIASHHSIEPLDFAPPTAEPNDLDFSVPGSIAERTAVHTVDY